MSSDLSRRSALRGAGVVLSLPWLEAMSGSKVGSRAIGSIGGVVAASGAGAASAASGTAAPMRMACIFVPNGVNYDAWNPSAAGVAAGGMSETLRPLSEVRSHLNVITGLTLHTARANGDGPGDHARSSAAFLTGHQARKTAGNDIRIGVSADQVAAAAIGGKTRLASLEIGCENSPSAGNCDSGYSCAYTSNISWRSEDVPMPKLVDPAAVFERLFGDSMNAAAASERISRRKSILDFVREDARRLEGRVGSGDRRKLDQFQSSVREVEQRIDRARKDSGNVRKPDMAQPTGIPRTMTEHADLMYDLLLLAFQTDTTRVATFMLGVDGSNRTFPEIGVKDGHHHLSHHQNNKEMIEKIRLIDRFYVERFARFIKRMSQERDAGGGSLLNSTMVLYGGGISDGNKHNHEDLPIVLAGGSSAGISGGRLIKTPRETPLCDLYVSMLGKLGCPVERFGDSKGEMRL